MKKIVALGLAVAGVFWVLGKKKSEKSSDTWAVGTDTV